MELLGFKLIGSGKEKVVVMHNWFNDSTCYDPMIPYIDTDNFTFLFVDLRGYGLSKDLKGTYSVQEASDDVVALVNSLDWKQFHVIGHSMSGMIAQKILLDHTPRIKSVIAITSVAACGSPGTPELMAFLTAAAESNDDYAVECFNLSTSRRYSSLIAQNFIDFWRSCSTAEARVGYLNMFTGTDFSKAIKGIQTPMLVISGEYDLEGLDAFYRSTFLEWYPNAQLEGCEAAGHFPMQETPIYLATLIEKFLSSRE